MPLAREWANTTRKKCCNLSEKTHIRDHIGGEIATLTANILVLSLLETDFETLRLQFDKKYDAMQARTYQDDMYTPVYEALVNNSPAVCGPATILSYLRRLLGHPEPPSSEGSWIASSYRGQVLFPRLFETMKLESEPSMRFLSVPGIMMRQGPANSPRLRYITSSVKGYGDDTPSMLEAIPSSEIHSLSRFNAIKSEWRSRLDKENLQAHVSVEVSTGDYVRVNPYYFLLQPVPLFFPRPCSHSIDQLGKEAIEDYEFVHPRWFLKRSSKPRQQDKIRVYAVRGNDPLRVMILGHLNACLDNWINIGSTIAVHWNTCLDDLIVIGSNACLSCSLDLCRRVGSRQLIC